MKNCDFGWCLDSWAAKNKRKEILLGKKEIHKYYFAKWHISAYIHAYT